ncbi:hypothetical protein RJ640_004134 [Escallonia rubra]|uniref:Reverse transcriptase Ty1/copia-type domain-containing protein n=1 Tax=Escallonia rubra TaxID=112253 RepID=A0AA88UPV7_9ASTE|nr:hypothetical protein RJ640_004134 [Escallonia rubra]
MASDTNFVQAAIPRFDGHYDHWSMLMENFLRSKEYWQVVESGVREPANDAVMTDAQKSELEGRKLKDLKAKNYLFQAIDRSILETILSKETSKDIWDSMKKKYQGSSRVKRAQLQALRRDFEVLQMKDEEGVEVEVEVEEGEIEAIEMATGISKPTTITLKAKGDVKIRTKNGFVETISNVLYVPDLKSNLLSAGQLQEKGYIITIQQGACEIYDPTKGAIVVVEMSSNRSPTFAVQDMTPEEAWSGRRPAVDHFRIFGCIAYAHVPDAKRKKLDDKSEKCVFLGVSEVSKAYKLFNPLTKKIVTSRDVVFEEESTWDWNRQQPTPVIFDSDAEEKMQPTPMISMPENTSNATPIVAETLPATGEATDVAVQSPRRARKRPAWMKDYKALGCVALVHQLLVDVGVVGNPVCLIFAILEASLLSFMVLGLLFDIFSDDLIYTGNDSVMFEEFKKSMMVEFEMSDLGMMHYFLGIEVVQSTNGIFICQKKYVREILDRFQMKDCNPVSTPTEFGLMLNKDHEGEKVDSTLYKQIVGSLMYLTATRPDIMHSVSLISRYMENPTEKHMLAAKRIFRYLQGTRDFGLFYKKSKKLDFFGFTDSDYAGDQDDRRSTSGYVFMLGTGAVSWSSKKQSIVTLSTTEAEFVAATACACQAIWLRRILEELQFKQTGATIVFCDNNSAIKLSKNPVLHGRSKHIDVKYYFLRDLSIDGTIDVKYCRSEAQVADIFTKPLRFLPFQKLRRLLGMCTLENSN